MTYTNTTALFSSNKMAGIFLFGPRLPIFPLCNIELYKLGKREVLIILFCHRVHIQAIIMADTAVAATPKAKKAPAKAKKPATHPKYSEMIAAAIGALKSRGGCSRSAILKYIVANYNVGANNTMINSHVKLALKAGVKAGTIKQAKGTGASGSFKLGEVKKAAPKKAKKPKAAKPKKVKKAKTPKKASVKKPAAKKPAAKKAKTPKKAAAKPKKAAAKPKKAAAKSPKKAKAAKPKKAKTPKKK